MGDQGVDSLACVAWELGEEVEWVMRERWKSVEEVVVGILWGFSETHPVYKCKSTKYLVILSNVCTLYIKSLSDSTYITF